MSVGENIKEARKKVGLTQSKLGEKLGVSGAMIAAWENGKRNPKPETIEKIANALGVPIWELHSTDELIRLLPSVLSFKANLGNEIQYLRWKNEVSQGQLAKKTGITEKKISMFEHGIIMPTVDEIIKICDSLGEDWYLAFASIFEDCEIEQKNERELLINYLQLNYEGRVEAIRRIEELTQLEKYTIEDKPLISPISEYADMKYKKGPASDTEE